ncbi:MAG: ABC transporter ATP-binding protein [Anaerolineaceae bacterium]|nr:ABC transporter ATP-binding protein [Anaerolineaceae bacterium]
MAYLSISNINKTFATNPVVSNFNLEVDKGEFISFLGPSGCGKTTTLRMIAGFELPTSGVVRLENEDITFKSPNQRNVGMVFQSYALFPNLTVAQNIGFGLDVRKTPKDVIQERAHEMLALIHLEDFGKRYPHQLSGGQQQRVALARALAIRPRVLLLDEPLSALDAKIRVELRSEIRNIQQKLGITTIYVTHDQEEALSISDRVVVMGQGHIEQVGTPSEIYNYPKTAFVASFVGQLNLAPVEVQDASQGLVKIGSQTVRTKQTNGKTNSDHPNLAVRPEEIHLGHLDEANNLLGRVDTITYLGAIVRIRMDIDGHPISMDLFNERELVLPRVGDSLEVHFPVHACWLL